MSNAARPSIPGTIVPATMRDHDVSERASTPLELLFDLCSVVAVAVLAAELDHSIIDGHGLEAGVKYVLLFVPIWWAWMSYTWFVTAFSHDHALTRLLTLLQMGGVLAVAAAIPSAWEGDLLPFASTYAAMRLPLVAQWVRAARDDPSHRAFALTYAGGSALSQALWVVGAVLPTAPTTASPWTGALSGCRARLCAGCPSLRLHFGHCVGGRRSRGPAASAGRDI